MGFEVNFDGLVGPTHHYAGLAYGNEASIKHRNLISNPKLAAKQGLQKMKALADLGMLQAILPPQHRPVFSELRRLGFQGSEQQILEQAYRIAPHILSALFSASSMWTANAATVSPSADTQDGKIHFTPANLCLNYHRSLEQHQTQKILKRIFNNEQYFAHHDALPSVPMFGDEGAANHLRFCQDYTKAGCEVFVYGKQFAQAGNSTEKYPARQTLEASQAIVRLHQLSEKRHFFLEQNPNVIDQGVFHNDVISVNNQNLFFVHEKAFVNQKQQLEKLKQHLERQNIALHLIEVPDHVVSVKEAVDSYLFNSQIISRPDGGMSLILPEETQQYESVQNYIQTLLIADNPIDDIKIFNLRESMRNGGGPACLRLRVVMTSQELSAMHQPILFTNELFKKLNQWIDCYYRDRLSLQDLIDPEFIIQNKIALDELTKILELNNLYSF
jgi:succinylarginine dihydrolase